MKVFVSIFDQMRKIKIFISFANFGNQLKKRFRKMKLFLDLEIQYLTY